jgi:tRNA(fMet)-specific endonuclease VapC
MVGLASRDSRSRGSRGPILTRLLLDTTFLIDAERSNTDLDDLIGDEDDVAIAAITLAELQAGVELSMGKTRQSRQDLRDAIVVAVPFVDYDLDVARAHAQLLAAVRRQGRPRGAHDLIIAATASSSGRCLLTADESAFVDLPGIVTISYR